jgi:hypothetical protein
MPSELPIDRKSHAKSIQLRHALIHSLSSRPVMSAAVANAKGTVQPTKPV